MDLGLVIFFWCSDASGNEEHMVEPENTNMFAKTLTNMAASLIECKALL